MTCDTASRRSSSSMRTGAGPPSAVPKGSRPARGGRTTCFSTSTSTATTGPGWGLPTRHAANSILRRLKGEPTLPFKYRDLGSAEAIGRFRAIVNFRGVRLSGFPGWVVWAFVHLTFLTGWGNRSTTLLKWTRSFIRRGRPEREFSVMHVGGDLSTSAAVRSLVQPSPLPAYRPASQLDGPPPVVGPQ